VDLRFRLDIWENNGRWAMADRHGHGHGPGSSFWFVRPCPNLSSERSDQHPSTYTGCIQCEYGASVAPGESCRRIRGMENKAVAEAPISR